MTIFFFLKYKSHNIVKVTYVNSIKTQNGSSKKNRVIIQDIHKKQSIISSIPNYNSRFYFESQTLKTLTIYSY